MVAKISFGSSLYGALTYNGEKINKEEGKLLATNKIFDDCLGKTSNADTTPMPCVISSDTFLRTSEQRSLSCIYP